MKANKLARKRRKNVLPEATFYACQTFEHYITAMKLLSTALIITSLLLYSCSGDLCQQTITYTKATGIYDDLEQYRIDQINGAPRTLVNPGKIFVSDDLLLIGEQDQGIHVIDNSDPTSPQFINFLEVPGNREMAVVGDVIYVDSYYDMLQIDISNPQNAMITSRIEEAFEIGLKDNQGRPLTGFEYEEVSETIGCDDYSIFNQDIAWFDYDGERIPESALPSSFVSNGSDAFGTVNRMAIEDDLLYVVGKYDLSIFDVRSGRFTSANTIEFFGDFMETIYPHDDHLFIGSRNSMAIYSLENPMSPSITGSFWHATSCDPVLPTDEGIAYVTLRGGDECPGDVNTLNSLNIENYSNPFLIQSLPLTSPFAMTIFQDQLYVGEGEYGYRVYDVNNGQMTEVEHNQSITAYDILPHPSDANTLLFIGPDGIAQYKKEVETLSLLSEIRY